MGQMLSFYVAETQESKKLSKGTFFRPHQNDNGRPYPLSPIV